MAQVVQFLRNQRRLIAVIAMLVLVPLGLALKRFRGPSEEWNNWVNNLGPASVAYEWFFIFLAFAIFPFRRWVARIAISVFVATCLIEFLQLWHPPWLQAIRRTLPGKLLLGTTFTWSDFPAYAVGCLTGWVLLRLICQGTPAGNNGQT